MSEVVLGRLINGPADRDAIHLAVIPMMAAETLKPAQRIGIMRDGAAGPSDLVVGIVDPFLVEDVHPGQKFWMCLLPNTVTGMRHHWRHPAFSPSPDIQSSEDWLREFARKNVPRMNPDEEFRKLLDGLRNGYLNFRGRTVNDIKDFDEGEELRRHAETYLGIRIDWDEFRFSCSC